MNSTPRFAIVLLLALTACSGTAGDTPTLPSPGTLAARSAAAPAPASVIVSFSTAVASITKAEVGAAVTATANVFDASKRPLTGVTICWRSSNTAVVVVPSACTTAAAVPLTARSVGTATITATVGSVAGSTVLTVTAPMVASITAKLVAVLPGEPAANPLDVGGVAHAQATVKSTSGATLTDATVCWESQNATVVTVATPTCASAAMPVTLQSRGVGQTMISARVGNASVSIPVSVIYPSSYGDPVILVHGLASSAKTWDDLASSLAVSGWREPYAAYGFSTSGAMLTSSFTPATHSARAGWFARLSFESATGLTFQQQGTRLAAVVKEVRRITGATKVVLIGHSMGGLASRAYVQSSSYAGDVSAVVTLGTPHTGALLANIADALQSSPSTWAAWINAVNGLSYGSALAAGNAVVRAYPATAYLAPNSTEMRSINLGTSPYGKLPTGIRYVSIVSSLPTASDVIQVLRTVSSDSRVVALFDAGWKVFRDAWVGFSTLQGAGVNLCSVAVQANWSDGIVPLCSQDLRASPISAGLKGPTTTALMSRFHMSETTDPALFDWVKSRAWTGTPPSTR